ncbi:MAG: SH3 domain-containing protein [Clostridia bacterium]|nr:SH3 domain-containing protein [Clostridia bacterium]
MHNSKKNAAVAAMLTMAMAIPMGAAAENETKVITCGTLNLREAATTESDVIGKYGWGTEVSVLGVSGDWSYVQVGGQNGYMYSKYLGSEGETNVAAYVATNSRGLNLRKSPNGEIITSFPRGTKVTILSTDGAWSKVSAGEYTGYMLSQWLSGSKPSSGSVQGSIGSAVVANPKDTQVLFLRSEPSIDSEALGYFRNGKSVTLLEKLDGWYKVNVDGKTGYMMSNFLNVKETHAANATVVNPNGNSYVNFRKGASLNAEVIRRIPVGTAIKVIEKTTDWTKTEIDGVTGYISTWFLKF